VDGDGRPLSGAAVDIEVRAEHEGTDGGFASEPEVRAETDARGRFEAHGRVAGREVRASAIREPFLPSEPQLAGSGSRGVRLVLGRGGAIEGVLLTDPEIRPSELEVFLESGRSRPDGSTAAGQCVRPDADGRWRIGAIPPGTVRAGVRVHEDRRPL